MDVLNQYSDSSYTGTGSLVTVSLGFKPEAVMIFNVTDGDWMGGFINGMTDDTAFKFGIVPAKISSNGITLTSTGFTVGTDATLNESGKTYRFIAFGNAYLQSKAFSYVGSASAQDINVGFRPLFVLAYNFTDGDTFWGLVDGLTVDSATISNSGFSLPVSSYSNENGKTYWCYAMGNIANQAKTGTYTGTNATQSIDIGFKPLFVITQNTTDGTTVAGHIRNMTDASCLVYTLGGATQTANSAITLSSTGFTLGATDYVNKSGKTFTYFAV